MTDFDSHAAAKPTNVRWEVFSLAFGTSALLYLHRYVFSFIKPKLAEDWNLSNTELGQLDSAFSICYTAFQFPIALAADALGVHSVLTILFLIWCGGLSLMAWSPSPRGMWFGQATLGIGQSAVYACLNRVARIWFPSAVRTTLQGAVGIFAGRLGALSSSLIFTSLLVGVLELPWRTAIWILVGVGLVQMLLFAVTFRNSPRQHPRVNAAELRLIEGDESPVVTTQRLSIRQMLSATTPRSFMNLIYFSLQVLLSTIADNIFSNWIPLFLIQVHHLEFKKMGIYAALPLLGGALAGPLGGVLNDYFIARTGNRRWSRAGVAICGKGLSAVVLLAAMLSYRDPYLFCMCLFFVKLLSDCSLTSAWGTVTDIGGRATASVFAFANSIAGLGLIAAPLLFGSIADHYGWPAVFITVAATNILCALSWLAIDCTIPVLSESES